jgi:hypothetical protein
MRLLAKRAALELPHDRKALAPLRGVFQVVGEFKKTVQEPRLPVETVVGQNGFRRRTAGRKRDRTAQHATEQPTSGQHGLAPNIHNFESV